MNKVVLMGRLTRDPETRYTQTNNTLVASFTLAINRRFTRQGEERQADFIPVVAWSKTGEFCSKYFKKGQQVGVIGRIQTRNTSLAGWMHSFSLYKTNSYPAVYTFLYR